MRLLNTSTYRYCDFSRQKIPPYAILSHVWGKDEVSYRSFLDCRHTTGDGFDKIFAFCRYAHAKGLQWCWIDTCCIDNSSSAELTYSLNAMFQWYQYSSLCVVYLRDVEAPELVLRLPQSKWFVRGFTLQELVAPERLDFVDKDWNCFYTLSKQGQPSRGLDVDLVLQAIATASRVSLTRLQQSWSFDPLHRPSANEIMYWASNRDTTRPEDKAYSLMGLFDIKMTLQYGEGDHAFHRLQRKILKRLEDDSLFDWADEVNCTSVKRSCLYTQGMLASSAKAFAKHDSSPQRTRELDVESPVISIFGQEISFHGYAWALEVPGLDQSVEFFVLPMVKSDRDLVIMKLRNSWTQYRVSGKTFQDYTGARLEDCVRTAASMQRFHIALEKTALPDPLELAFSRVSVYEDTMY